MKHNSQYKVEDTRSQQLLIDINGLQKLLPLGVSSIYKLMASGALPYVKVGKRTFFRPSDIEAYVSGLGRAAS